MSELMRRCRVPSERQRRRWRWSERGRGTLGKLLSAALRLVLTPATLSVPRTTTAELRRSAAAAARLCERRAAKAALPGVLPT